MASIDALDQIEARFLFEEGDHERFAHYVEKNESMRGYVEGTPVIALCGKVWVPSRDPKKFPVCPTCKDIVDALFLPHE
jgi:hypothetical protein